MSSSFNAALRRYAAAFRVLLVLTVILGVTYPLAVTAIGRLAFADQASGSLVSVDGQVVGSSQLGQAFTDADGEPLPQWFQPRPSAAGDGYDALSSSASNLGPNNAELVELVAQRRAAVAAFDGVDPASVPPDALLASGSGLDPDISPEYARQQAPRVADARGLEPAQVRELVDDHVEGRVLGLLGAPTVNVLELNLALDQLAD